MKKILMTAAFALAACVGAQAQLAPSFKVTANLGFSNVSAKILGHELPTKMIPGLRIGAAADLNIGTSGVYVSPGVAYMMKGSKTQELKILGITVVKAATTRLHYLEVPVNLGFRGAFGNNLAAFAEFGPYFACGLTSTGDSNKNAFDGDLGFKRFDAGIGVAAGIEYSNFIFQVGTQFGFINMYKDAQEKTSSYNRDFYLGVGYRF